MFDVTCGDCREKAQIVAPADVWKCPSCGELNEAFGTENNPPDRTGEAADLEAKLIELRGSVAPEGDTNV